MSEKQAQRLLIVTGLSGAGRSTCLKILEDLGYDAVDNLPMALFRRLLANDTSFDRSIAIGLDTRTIGFDPLAILDILKIADRRDDLMPYLIFCDCDDRVIQQRYSESRRPHPMADDRGVADGISMERQLMSPLQVRADVWLDTTETSPRELRERLITDFGKDRHQRFTLRVMSFAFRHGLPRDADLVFDVRFLRNPHYEPDLRHRTGLDEDVQAFVRSDEDFQRFSSGLFALIVPLIARYRDEGKSYLTIAFGCTGGQHRSVFLAELMSSQLSREGWAAKTWHREIEAKRTSDHGTA